MADHSYADTRALAGVESPHDGLLRAVQRTQTVVDEETESLARGGMDDHDEFRHRKDLCLLDLSRRSPAFVHPPRDPELTTALRNLKDAIIRNQKALRCHINAARQVSAIVMKAIADEDSDRTYSAYLVRKGARI